MDAGVSPEGPPLSLAASQPGQHPETGSGARSPENAGSVVGRRYDFAFINSVAAYQDRVPLTTYEDWEDDVDRIAAGETGILTSEPDRLLEPTSGSTAATKWIPYTDSLQEEGQRAGDVKPTIFHATADWSTHFEGQFLECSPPSPDG